MIAKLRLEYPVWLLCKVLLVSSSGFYAWLQRPSLQQRTQPQSREQALILAAHVRTRKTFGAVRLHRFLKREGHVISLWRVRKIRREAGISCIQKRKYKCRTTDSNHSLPVASNLLERRFTVNQPDSGWVSDITYIPTGEGWLYLAGVKDLFSKQIVGFSMAATMDKSLVLNALKRAVSVHRSAAGIILHSDRGSQYCSHRYRRLASFYGFRLSMSKKGDCYDNAPMESFWGILKNELVHHRKYRTRAEAMADISEYIEIFYNRQRLQAGLGYLSPAEFSRLYQSQHYTNAA